MNWTKTIFYILLGLVLIAAVVFYHQVFHYLIAAWVFSYILDPAVTYFEHRRIPRWLSVLLVYLIVFALLAWFASRMIPEIMTQGRNFISVLTSDDLSGTMILTKVPFLDGVYEFTQSLDQKLKIPDLSLGDTFVKALDKGVVFVKDLPQYLQANWSEIYSKVFPKISPKPKIFSKIVGVVSFIGMIPLISFFLLKDRLKFRRSILKLSSNRYFELSFIILDKIDNTVGTYLRAMLFEVIAVAVMTFIALRIIGVSNPILIGIAAGVANIIPYFGPFFAGVLAVGTVFFEGGALIEMIYAALAMWAVQLVDNNLVYPTVVGTTINMHPLLVLLTVLAGGWYGGLLWMLISVPLVFLIYSLINVLYTNLKEYRII